MQHLFNNISALAPISTDIEVEIPSISGIKAVLFDIYGTLMISASGDIGSTELRGQTALETFEENQLSLKCSMTPIECGKLIISEYEETIHEHHGHGRDLGHPNPEVDIVQIWREVLTEMKDNAVITSPIENIDHETLALNFEMKNNPVYPMPNMESTLATLSDANLRLGIVSNAQFFTPLLLKHFMGKTLEQDLPYFDEDLQVYSYELKRAKPDVYLYEKMAEQLNIHDLTPSQCLYVGNDMLNDIAPAQEAGFKTVLFAGDTRSLRLRSHHPRVMGVKADAVITDLKQILTIIGA